METTRMVGILSQGKHRYQQHKEVFINVHVVATEIFALRDFTGENLFIGRLNDRSACLLLTSGNETAWTI